MRKRLLSILLCVCMALTAVTPSYALGSSFEDMPEENHWSYNALKSAVDNGLIQGYDGRLNPTAAVSRAQLAAVLNRAFGATETGDISKFTDVPADKWYHSEMAKALKMGTFNGNTDNKLLPENDATRQEAFCVIARALNLSSADLSPLDKFSDKGAIADWAKEALSALTENGYVNGDGGALNPNAKITLAEFAKLMDNVFESYISVKGTFSPETEGNVMINCPDVVLKDGHIKGDLILGDGVGNGDITVDNTKIDGRLIVRGGGKNSIKLINNTEVGTIIISKKASGAVRVAAESGAKVKVVVINDGADDIIIEGTFEQIVISSDTPVVLNNAAVSEMSLNAPAAEVKVAGSTKIESAKVAENAIGAKIDVAKNASVQKLDSAAPAVVIGGEGKVETATVSGADTQVNTNGTELTVAKGTEGVKENGNIVAPTGEPVKTATSAESGDDGPSDPSQPTEPDPASRSVSTLAELVAAMEDDTVSSIAVTDNITLTDDLTLTKSLTVSEGKTLTVGADCTLTVNQQLTVAYGATLDNNGTIVIDNNSNLFVENEGLDSEHHGMLDNEEGIIELRSGWLDYRDYNGAPTPWFTPNPDETVRTYYTLADVARELYYNQNNFGTDTDMLTAATQSEIAAYSGQYSDWSELQNEFNDDTDGVKAIAMLLKNDILIPAEADKLHPYDAVTKIQTIELVHKFARSIISKNGLTDINTGSDIVFNDISALPEAQKTGISYLARAGILEADNEGNLNPDSLVSSVCGEKINGSLVEFTWLNTACDTLMSKLSEQEVVVTNIEQLKAALNSDIENQIFINGDITLDANMTIIRDVEIASGAALRAGTYNLTLGYETEEDEYDREYMSEYGSVIVKGTLDVPVDSTLYNLTEISLEGGTLNVGGSYVDTDGNMIDGEVQRGRLDGTDATLNNQGAFENKGTVRLINCDFTNTGDYTNSGILEVTGGSITAETGDFDNAGQFRIEDVYGDDKNICEVDIEDTLTNDSSPVEYVGVVMTEQGLREALAYHKQRYDERKNEENRFGLNYYGQIDINDDITINDSLDVQDVDLYVNRIVEYVEGYDQPQTKVCTLTNNGYINLKNSNLYVYGAVVNDGTINVGVVPGEELEGQEEQRGSIRVQPLGVFENTNTGTLSLNNGEFLRYDELNVGSDSNEFGKNVGVTIGVSSDIIKHVAIVHDLLGLKQAAAKDGQTNYTDQEYDQIDVKSGSEAADIVLDGSLTIDADLYIAWGRGIEVPENRTLSFTGDNHYIDNQGDLWVYGTLNLGSGYRLMNQSKIQVGGSQDVTNKAKFVNAGVIENANLIEVLINGIFENNETIFNTGDINVNGGEFTGTGDVYNEQNGHAVGVPNAVSIAQNTGELQNLISFDTKNILISDNIILYSDIIIPNEFTVYLGKDGYRHGELKTCDPDDPESHTITVEAGAKLVLSDGDLEINCSGKLINNGTIECGTMGIIRIENGSTMQTSTDIDVYGGLDLYDWENRKNYITGDGQITVYSDRARFIESLFARLYGYQDCDQNGDELETPVITPVADFASYIAAESAVKNAYSEFNDWFERSEGGNNYLRRYAYAAMKANGILGVGGSGTLRGSETLEDGEPHYPYEKLTYAYLKSVLTAVSGRFSSIDDGSIANYVDGLKGTDEFVPQSFGWNAEAFSETDSGRDILDGFFETVNEVLHPETA